ncbi:hypothetical protein L596_020640 [Steinernema carpocapsae]|uniref:Uncharacterized protein n=1 Tax=Steinernema carpocapsae TaxID=34508 RepID=A0A4U5MU55_STECR|nr:hypothetical protein L596_020640 [Steinernema carpocapsae]
MMVFDPYVNVPQSVVLLNRMEHHGYANNINNYITILGMFILYTALVILRSTGSSQRVKIQVVRSKRLHSLDHNSVIYDQHACTPAWILLYSHVLCASFHGYHLHGIAHVLDWK